ncbi:MAG TPA: DNA polymerase, partial [Acidimicrobiales bacterium]
MPTKPSTPPTSAGETRPLILLDGMSLAFRAYFALPDTLKTSAGVTTNAVHGFTSMVLNLVKDHDPVGLAVAFDLPGGTFRDDTPPDLPPQFGMIREVMESLCIPVLGAEGFEADDVLATLASEARDRGHPVIIVTGDRDSYQLVEDPYIRVLYNRRGVSDYALYDEAGIEERTGVLPHKYPLLAALRGDPSDNLPGVPGVGEKTAAKLINEYGDLDTLYAHLDALSPKLRQNLADHAERVRLNAEVIPLVRDVPLDVDVDHLRLGGWNHEDARKAFASLEMKGAWTRFESAMKSGLFGASVDGGSGGAGSEDAGDAVPQDQPTWLETPVCAVPSDVDQACSDLVALFATVRSTTGNVAVAPLWEGDPGRSPLLAMALVAEATDEAGDRPTPAVYLGPHPGGHLVADRRVLDALADGLGPGGVGVVAHDAKELMRSLLPVSVDLTGLAVDTAVAAYLLDPSDDRYRLSDLAPRFLGVAVDDGSGAKGQGAFLLEAEAEVGDGTPAPTGLDHTGLGLVRLAAVLARLRTPLRNALADIGEEGLFDNMERPLVRVLARMEVVGIPVDRAVLRTIAAELTAECQSLETTMHELAGGPFNVNSVKQLRTVLYEDLGLQPGRKTKTGFSTDARTLESLRGQHPIIEVLLRYREVEKLRSTYGETLAAEVAPDGRIHATFRQTVARTGRLSSA